MSGLIKKIKYPVVLVIILLLIYEYVSDNFGSDLTKEGSQVMALGNRKIVFDPPPGMILVTEEDDKKRINFESALFVIDGDSNFAGMVEIEAASFLMEKMKNFEDLIETWKVYDSLDFIYVIDIKWYNIDSNYMDVFSEIELDSVRTNMFQRYYICAPYFLSLTSKWRGDAIVPMEFYHAMENLKVEN